MRQRTCLCLLVCHSRSGVTQALMRSWLKERRHHLAVLHVSLSLLTFKGLFLTFLNTVSSSAFQTVSVREESRQQRLSSPPSLFLKRRPQDHRHHHVLQFEVKIKCPAVKKGHDFNDAASSGLIVMFNTTSGPEPLLSSHVLNPPSFPLICTHGSFHQNPEVGLSEFPETTSSETLADVRI